MKCYARLYLRLPVISPTFYFYITDFELKDTLDNMLSLFLKLQINLTNLFNISQNTLPFFHQYGQADNSTKHYMEMTTHLKTKAEIKCLRSECGELN